MVVRANVHTYYTAERAQGGDGTFGHPLLDQLYAALFRACCEAYKLHGVGVHARRTCSCSALVLTSSKLVSESAAVMERCDAFAKRSIALNTSCVRYMTGETSCVCKETC